MMTVELRYGGEPPQIERDVQRVLVTFNGCKYEFYPRNSGIYVRASEPIHHALIVVPMGLNSIALFHQREPE